MSVAVVGAATLATTFAAVPAHAVEPIVSDALAFPSVSAFVVDGLHHHLLFGGGSAHNGVLVTDTAGVTVTTATTAGGVDDITLSPDGTTAYAASSAVDKIYKIDLATFVVTPISLPAGDCPVSVAAVSATLVAFGYTCNASFGGVGVLNVTTSAVQISGGSDYYAPTVRALKGTTKFVAANHMLSETVAGEFQASTGAPVLMHDTSSFSYGLPSCEYMSDMAISPDGQSLLVACGNGYDTLLREYAIADFTASGTYPAGTPVTSAAYSPDGNYVGAGMNGDYDDDFAVFKNDTSLLYSLDYGEDYSGNAGPSTPAHGVAFSADGTQFYTLAANDPDEPNTVWLVTLPATSVPTFPPVSPPPTSTTGSSSTSTPTTTAKPVASTITVVSPPRQFVGHAFAVSGTLAFAGLPAAGVTIQVSKTLNGVTTPVGTTTTTATGAFSYSITPTAIGVVTYSAGFVGDLGHYGSSASAETTGARAPAAVTLKVAKVKGKVYAVTVHLASWGVNRHVLISANKKVIGKGVVNSKGILTVHFTRKKATTFVAVFTGDANDFPARATKGLH
jgi:hypothetical protein